MIFHNMGIQGLVNTISNMMRTPIIDATGIEGRYDFTLDPARFATTPGDAIDRAQAVAQGSGRKTRSLVPGTPQCFAASIRQLYQF